jgi:23S rRNA (cytosine1962-C5)-methyltransferase
MNGEIYLKKNEERRINSGHLWVFSNEIDKIENSPENGDIVFIYDSKKIFLGSGFYNKNSLIAVRILSAHKIDNIKAYLQQKINSAFSLRKDIYPVRESFRMVFSESDFLPGLIIDKYNNTFVLQIYSAGMEKNIDKIVEILTEDFSAENIFTKNEKHYRILEGLPEEDKVYLGNISSELINDGKINYKINFELGHKTGFYFDQNDNRFFIEKIVKNKSVLDAFCNSGGFGLHAASAGALSVSFLDSSKNEIDSARQNFELNNFNIPAEFIAEDVFDHFEKCINQNKKFDVVIIDPPAFAKSKKNIPQAKKGYEKLNKLAMQLVNENGFLVTSSCSHHLSGDEFIKIITAASSKAGKKLQMIFFNSASLDHPQLPAMNETAYLKFAVFNVKGSN